MKPTIDLSFELKVDPKPNFQVPVPLFLFILISTF